MWVLVSARSGGRQGKAERRAAARPHSDVPDQIAGAVWFAVPWMGGLGDGMVDFSGVSCFVGG